MNKSIKRLIPLAILVLVFFAFYFGRTSANTESQLIHFVQITDTHLASPSLKDDVRLRKSSEKLLKTLVKQINEIKDLDLVVGSGDLVDIPDEKLLDKFIEITDGFNYPFYAVLGNHDVGPGAKLRKAGFIKKFYSKKDALSFINKKPYYSFSPHEKLLFICLDGTTETKLTSNGFADKNQLKWLESEIGKNKDKYILLFSHFPVVEPFPSKSHNIVMPDRKNLQNIINKNKNIIGYFSGHYHAARLIKVNNMIYNSCPAIIQFPCAFREVTIKEDLKKKELLIDFKWHVVNEPELVKKSKDASKSWILNYGAPEDRVKTVTLKI